MPELIRGLDALIDVLRTLFSVALLIALPLAVLGWAVRARHVQPFGALARLSRQLVDPLVAPIDRRVARFGGTHASGPWWAFLALLLAGAVTLGALGFVRDFLVGAYYASSRGPRGLLRAGIGLVFGVLQLALLVRVILSWLGGSYSAVGRLAWRLTEWMLVPLRRVLPSVGMIDLSPLVAWFALGLLRGFVLGAL